jgi:hypothetical protein
MKYFHSKIDGRLNHILCKRGDLESQSVARENLSPDSSFLQLGLINTNERSYPPHFHLERHAEFDDLRAQECWIVVKGKVEVTYFDVDNTVQGVEIIEAGDATLTLFGGHGYRVLEAGTLVYEVKSGPYLGISIDKKEITTI